MKIAIVGAGAIGGLLGARLSRAGEQVTFIARNKNLLAIQANGFKLILEDDSEELAPAAKAVLNMRDAGIQDVVFLTVKAHQVRELLPDLLSMMGEKTLLVTMINGIPWWYFQKSDGRFSGTVLNSVDPDGEIAKHINPECIIGCIVYPAAELVAPGVVRVIEGNRFTLGELDGSRSERIEALSHAMMAAGFKAPVSRDIRGEIWLKLWGNLSFNPISALTHATLEDICTFEPSRDLVANMMREAQTIAEKLGVVFKISLEKRIAGAQAVGAHKTSMLQDVENGRALELNALGGSVVELGRITQTPTPHIDAIYAATRLLAHTLASQRSKLQLSAVSVG